MEEITRWDLHQMSEKSASGGTRRALEGGRGYLCHNQTPKPCARQAISAGFSRLAADSNQTRLTMKNPF
jgi:hypothetical protein